MKSTPLHTLARALERLTANHWARWAFFFITAAAATWPYLRTAGAFNDFRDANVLWLYEDSARRSVLDFGQLPFWNPDFCGGLPALGTPQSRFASPTFLFTLLFGTTRAEPLTVFAMVLLALQGTYRYARERGAKHLGATLAAPVFGLMGIFACAPFLGWFGFLGFALLPWVLVGTRQAARGEVKGAALIAFSTAFMVGFGGTYVAPISLVACVLELVLFAITTKGRVSVATLAVAGLLAVGVSAVRLWPVWEELQRAPRLIAGISANSLMTLGANLFGTWPAFTEEAWYLVGVPAAVVASLALVRRRFSSLPVALLFWLWLASGNASTPSLYNLLRRLPVFALLRNAERFLVPAVLVIAIGAALAVTDFQARLRLTRRSLRFNQASQLGLLLCLLGLVATVPLLSWNFSLAAHKRTLVAPPAEELRPFHQARGNRWSAALFGPMSRGSLACWEAYTVPQSPKLRADLQQESWLVDPSAGSLNRLHWSPQRLDFQLGLERPARLVINQNYHRGWKSSVGQVVNDEGLLAIDLPAGRHDLAVRFLPTSAVAGLTVSLLAAVAALLLLRTQRVAVRLVLAIVPLLVGAAFAWSSNEPALPSRVPAGPEGEVLIASTLPEGTTPLGVQFGADVRLEGAKLTYRPEDDRVRVELDWSHGQAVNRRLGFFVHIEPGATKRITADHLQLSDGLFLEEGPDGAVLRDIMLIDVPESKRAEPWNVWVGVWEMRGSGERIGVTDAHGATVQESRVLVGTLNLPKRNEPTSPR